MEAVITQCLNGLSFIAILGLIGIGLAILLGMMGVINMAHGEFVMLGAYVVWICGFVVHNFWLCLVLAVVLVALFSLVIEWALIRPLYKRPMETILVTWGLGIILRELAKLVFGNSYKVVQAPIPGFIPILGVHYSAYRFFVICIAFAILLGMVVFFLKTEYGLRARAIIFDRQMASALGVNVGRTNQLMFAIGAGLAALSGGLIAPIYVLSPSMGLHWVVRAFFVVVIGGVGSIWGPIGGATVMGGSQGITEYYLSSVAAQVVILSVAIVVVRLRPKGLFAEH